MKYTRQDNVIDLNEVWWTKQFALIQQQAEQIEDTIYEVLDDGVECDYDPCEVRTFTGHADYKIVGEKATWTAFILYFDGKPAFTVNVACDRRYGAAIVNCGRLIHGRLEFFYCTEFEEVLTAARRYAKEHILPELEFED